MVTRNTVVLVAGYPKSTKHDVLQTFIESFGETVFFKYTPVQSAVKYVEVDSTKSLLETSKSFEGISLNISVVLREGKHKLQDLEAFPLKTPTLMITGYSNKTFKTDIRHFFGSFGQIAKIKIQLDYTTVQYQTEDSYYGLMLTPQTLDGCLLDITIATKNDLKRKRVECEKSPVKEKVKHSVVHSLVHCQTPEQQLHELINLLQVPWIEIQQKYAVLCQDLENTLNESSTFQGCKAMPFGSTVTGLALKGSDLDVFVLTPRLSRRPPVGVELSEHLVNLARKPLVRRQDLFARVIAITRAKTPLIKCIHHPTKINCDVTFKNMLGVANSSLVKFLLDTDPRLRPMMLILKYWAEINTITGVGRITNYTLVILVIFFLQQKPNRILPSISSLQYPPYAEIIEGWDAGFNYNFYFPIQNNCSILTLLSNFFEFYSTYDFGLKIVCPFTGLDAPRIDFKSTHSVPQRYWRYRQMVDQRSIEPLNVDSVMCVQDPFEHNHNIAKNVSIITLKQLQSSCVEGLRICKEAIQGNKLIDLLPTLLSHEVPTLVKGNEFEVELLATSVAKVVNEVPDGVDKEEYQQKMWFKKVKELLVLILTKILLYEINVNGEEVSRDEEDCTINCTGYYLTHVGRNRAKGKSRKIAANRSNPYSNQVGITKQLLQDHYKEEKKLPENLRKPILEFDIQMTTKKNPTKVLLRLKNRTNQLKSHFLTCMQFLQYNLPPWIEKYMTLDPSAFCEKTTEELATTSTGGETIEEQLTTATIGGETTEEQLTTATTGVETTEEQLTTATIGGETTEEQLTTATISGETTEEHWWED